MAKGRVGMGACNFGTGIGNFGTDGETSCWDTFVSARAEQLPKRDLMGASGPEAIKV